MAPVSLFARLRTETRAISSVEFAVIFPTLLLLMLGSLQLVAYINAVRKVEATASSISEMLSQAYDPNNPAATTVYLAAADLQFAFDQTMVTFPYLLKDAARQNKQWSQDILIDFASIQFKTNGTSCGTAYDQSACYSANIVWTTSGLGSNFRACGTQQPTTSTVPTNGFLPSNVFGPGSLIAVDVVFTFVPAFTVNFHMLGGLFGAQRIARSVYVQPRYAALIDLNLLNTDKIATRCLLPAL